MATKQHAPPPPPSISGDTFAALEGMSRSQLYDLMSKMKLLIDQNQQQARKVLVENPHLTKALFQAQIMLGMVKPPQAVPNVQQTLSQPQPAQVGQKPIVSNSQSLPAQASQPTQTSSSQTPVQATQQHPAQPPVHTQSAPIPSLAYSSHQMPSNPGHQNSNLPQPVHQNKGYMNARLPSAPSQSTNIHNPSQIRNLPPPPPPQNYSIPQSHMPMGSSQRHQSLHTPNVMHQPLQPPLPQPPRPPSLPPFQHQLHSQMPHGHGFQQPSAPQQFPPQSMYHPIGNQPASFPHGQPPMPTQQPQQLYQGSLHIGSDYGSQAGPSMHGGATGLQLPGPPQLIPGQILQAPGGHGPRPPLLTADVEKALLQQVMSLTPEQISLLPPEQQSQVIKLQEMLRS